MNSGLDTHRRHNADRTQPLGFEMGHLEMIIADLIIFQKAMFGLVRCFAKFAGVNRNG